MTVAATIDLSGLPVGMQAKLSRICVQVGASALVRDGGDVPRGADISCHYLGSANPAEMEVLRAGIAQAQTAALVLVAGKYAAEALAKIGLPGHIMLLAWPANNATVALHLRQLLLNPTPVAGARRDRALVERVMRSYGLARFEFDLSLEASVGSANPADALRLVHPDDQAQFRDGIERSRRGGDPMRADVRCVDAGGAFRWTRYEGEVVGQTQDVPGWLVGFRHDIEGEVSARQATRMSTRHLEEALIGAGMASWEWSRDVGTRKVVADGLGWWRDAGIMDLDALIAPNIATADHARFEAAVRAGTRYHSEIEVYRPSIGLRHLRISAAPLAIDAGGVTRMSGVVQDITEQHNREVELMAAQDLLATSLEAATMYCWEWDLRTGRRRALGPSERVLGACVENGENAIATVHPQDREKDEALLREAITSGGHYQNEFRCVRPDGAIRWIHSRGSAVHGNDNEVIKLCGVAIDITERREAELSLDDANRRMNLAMRAARLNPWSVDLVNERHFPGPLDEEFFGNALTSEESFLRRVHPEDHAIVAKMRDPVFLRSGQPEEVLFRVFHADGALRWIRCNVQSVCDEHGDPVQLVGVSKDVTDLHLANQRLLRTQAEIDDAQRITKLALWEWAPNEGLRYFRSAGRLLARADLPEIHQQDRRKVLVALIKTLRTGKHFDQEFRIQRRDGQLGWVSVQGGMTNSTRDGTSVVRGVLLEVTDRRESAAKLMAAQERLEKALEAGGMFWWTWVLSGQSDRNDSFALPLETGFGTVHPDDVGIHRDALHAALATPGGAYHSELRVKNELDSYEWLLVSGQRSSAVDGDVVELSGVAINITARKSVEKMLMESREWQQVAVGAAELNLWRVELGTGRRLGGDFDLRMYGESPGTLDDMLSRIEPEDRALVADAIAHATETGRAYEIEYRLRTPIGEMRWMRDLGEIVAGAGSDDPQLVGVSLDISRQRQSTDELNRALRLAQEASEAKSSFLAAMSHELRTPLNAVIGFAGLLDGNTDPNVRDSHLHALQEGAHQLMSVINDVLDFSRIEADALVLESAPFSLSDCIASALQMVAGAAEAKGLCLSMVAHDAQGDRFMGDATRIRQVALNLLSNAVKFTNEGAIALYLGIFREADAADIVIGVADTGIGMPQETVDRLFTPFRQGDSSTVRHYGGSGLGLSICKKLVGLMGGTIEVESSPGSGTRFLVRIRLPVVADLHAQQRRPLTGRRIGCSVKSPHLRKAIVDQLREYGATPVILEAETLDQTALENAGPLSTLVVGQPLLPRLAQVEHWPLGADGLALLPLVTLVGIDVPQVEGIGIQGQRIMPISRALTPKQLLVALLSTANSGYLPTQHAGRSGDHDEFEGLKVLIVEDNEINRTILMLQLEELGIVAQIADSGEEAIRMLSSSPCDIILMDVEMPGMDGLQATALILDGVARNQNPPYVVAVTAHVFGDTREKMRSAGMVDFVSKPVVVSELRAALRRGRSAILAGR